MPTPVPADPESIELATLDAVPPQATERLRDWVLAYDDGTVGRAHSAVPLRHDSCEPEVLQEIERRYASRGLEPMLRLARIPAFSPLRNELEQRGWRAQKPTAVEVATCESVAASGAEIDVEFTDAPTARWSEVFLGEGFDPVDGASRLGILRRARSSVFATVTVEDKVAAVGSAGYSQGWCGIHGMRTAPAFRGRGFAGGIIAAFAREALSRGLTRAFLQVEQGNARARSIYARAGFGEAWVYEYWAR
ncbi:GNAT family N-acetyltransferase [Ramlibacter albus]|uniref:GNAT family N-acetyltransferase n=1 Tax=Ramlibacter albus TaxID=2079448 RepID=A0A923M9D6_9BURK|nr:GNAT family N-acetyltransferase [Ramlibacter albus]MBC5766425.1 GNAT family N-acetyltransferase [Ramlibacter albus]